MKTGRSLSQLASEIERQANSKRDFIAPTQALDLVSSEKYPEAPVRLNIHDVGQFDINQTAHNQIAEHCGIPKPYYNRMMNVPHLLAHNVNHWFHTGNDKRMVRTLDDKARAFLSNKYRPLDNVDLAEAVLPVIMDHKWSVKSCEITEQKLYIKVVSDQITAEIPQDHMLRSGSAHIVHPGLVITNSEIGMGRLQCTPTLHWEHCLNLALMDELGMGRNHVGKRDERFGDIASEFFKDETRKMDDTAFWMKIRDVVQATLNETIFMQMVDKFIQAKSARIEGDPVKVIEVTAKQYQLNEPERVSILKHLIEGADLSAYGLSNAITRASQDVDSYDRATELERLGGQIVELQPSEWKVISQVQ